MFSVAFWKGAGERALKTFVQTFVAVVAITAGTGAVPVVGVGGVNWLGALSVALVAAVLSLGTSLGNAEFTAGGREGREVPQVSDVDPSVYVPKHRA